MRSNAKWIVAALGCAVLTAGCVQDGGYYPNTGYNSGYRYYPSTAYSYPASSYGYRYQASAYNSGGYWNSASRDADRDGIPNRYDGDANGDGMPDRYQGRPRY